MHVGGHVLTRDVQGSPVAVTLADELLLLALTPDSGKQRGAELSIGLVGALLAELLLDGRAYLDDRGLVVPGWGEPSRGPDPDLDWLAGQIVDRSEQSERRLGWFTLVVSPREPTWWVNQADAELDTRRCGALLERGLVVAAERTRGIIVTHGHVPADPATCAERLRHLGRVLTGAAPPDPRSVALLALFRAVELEEVLFGEGRNHQHAPDIEEDVTTDPVGVAVREHIAARRAARQSAPTIIGGVGGAVG